MGKCLLLTTITTFNRQFSRGTYVATLVTCSLLPVASAVYNWIIKPIKRTYTHVISVEKPQWDATGDLFRHCADTVN